MMLDVIAIGPPFFCIVMWLVGTVTYGTHMIFVRSAKTRAQNQALEAIGDPGSPQPQR